MDIERELVEVLERELLAQSVARLAEIELELARAMDGERELVAITASRISLRRASRMPCWKESSSSLDLRSERRAERFFRDCFTGFDFVDCFFMGALLR